MSSKRFKRLEFERLPPEIMHARATQFYKTLVKRRSIRQFSNEPIDRAVLENCLLTAGSAPSGANRQPWHFVVITDPEIKKRIRQAAEKEEREFYEVRATTEWLEAIAPMGVDENKPFLEEAPCLIVIFSEHYRVQTDGKQEKNYYVSESVGIATGFLIAALHNAGLATLTHTPSPMEFLSEILNRPKNEKAFLILVVGYPAEDARVPELTKKSLETLSSWH